MPLDPPNKISGGLGQGSMLKGLQQNFDSLSGQVSQGASAISGLIDGFDDHEERITRLESRTTGMVGEVKDILLIRKLANQTVEGADQIFRNDEHLFFSIGANETWLLEMRWLLAFHGGAFKQKFVVPTGTTFAGEAVYTTGDTRSTKGSEGAFKQITEASTTINHQYGVNAFGTIDSQFSIISESGFLTTGSTGGTFQLQYAMSSSGAENGGTFYKDSYIKATRVV